MLALTLLQAMHQHMMKHKDCKKTGYYGSDMAQNKKKKYFPEPWIQETDKNKYTCTNNGYLTLQNDKKQVTKHVIKLH